MAWVTRQIRGARGGVVVVIVFIVERHRTVRDRHFGRNERQDLRVKDMLKVGTPGRSGDYFKKNEVLADPVLGGGQMMSCQGAKLFRQWYSKRAGLSDYHHTRPTL